MDNSEVLSEILSNIAKYRCHYSKSSGFFFSPSGAWVPHEEIERAFKNIIKSKSGSKMECKLTKSTKNDRVYKACLSGIDNSPFETKVFYGEVPELINRSVSLFDQIVWEPEYSNQFSLSNEERILIKYAFEEMQKPPVTKSKLAEYF